MAGKRVTVNLMTQPGLLATLAALQKGVARTTGFLARFLLCEPASTMGDRPYREPRGLAALDRFTARTEELFARPLPVSEESDFKLDPPLLQLDPEAFAVWHAYHDEVEAALKPEGDLIDIPDFAAKSAEQAARLAGCFHIFTGRDVEELVDAQTMRDACDVAQWYLVETLRVTQVRAVPELIADAIILWEWARDRDTFTGKEVATLGPNRLRRDSAGVLCKRSAL